MIKYIVMDVDGTLTDGKIYISKDGEVMKAFSVKDGLGIRHIINTSGIVPVIITGRYSPIVAKRCEELGIKEIYQNASNKKEELLSITNELSTVAYIGDDVNDLDVMIQIKEAGGIVGCPADASNNVKNVSDFISSRNGGDGAVREFIEWIVEMEDNNDTIYK